MGQVDPEHLDDARGVVAELAFEIAGQLNYERAALLFRFWVLVLQG